jgi:hypothetical protein
MRRDGNDKASMPAGFITLGQIGERLSVLEVSCNRCDRRGRLNVDRLITEHGPQLPAPGTPPDHRRRLSTNDSGTSARRVRSAFPGVGPITGQSDR